jgi:3-dehydroquinate synthase
MHNLIITGFMGTGKSIVGREVARRLNRRFVDMDAEIEARAGRPIPRIFAEDGEPAFRDMETTLCLELSRRDGQVIATGGGTLVTPQNRARMLEQDTVVCLHANPEEVLQRVGDDDERPLLDVDDRAAEIQRLLADRREAYAALPWHVNTTGLSIEKVVARVIALAAARTLPVRCPGGSYDVHVGTGLLDHVGGALRDAGVPAGTRVALVSNDIVAPLYAEQVAGSLSTAYLRPFTCILPDGEQHKTLETVASLYDQFLAAGLDRGGLVISLGGGVTGDVAGFAAASFMRGVRFAQVPTTLLAMVDASVGGKTGVDLPQGKNLVGAFKQPIAVTIDPRVLSTLEPAEVRSGMAEVIKHGVIGAPDLFADLENAWQAKRSHGAEQSGSMEPTAGATRVAGLSDPRTARSPLSTQQIARALRVKIEIVEQDPYERGRRAVLNLGHTVGHAVEKLSGFELRHGEAVSIGMVAAARLAVKLGRAEQEVADRIEAALAAWDLPIRCTGPGQGSFRAHRVWQAMAHDKKRRSDTLRWVLPLAIGRVIISEDVPQELVLSVLREMGAL